MKMVKNILKCFSVAAILAVGLQACHEAKFHVQGEIHSFSESGGFAPLRSVVSPLVYPALPENHELGVNN